MQSYSTRMTRRGLIAFGCLALVGCAPAPPARPVASTAVLPPGASRIAVEISIEIIDTLRDVTQRTDRAELDGYVNAAMTALAQKLAAEKLELVPAPASAPLQMRLALKVRRSDPIIGGLTASARATVIDDAGQERFNASGSSGYHLFKTVRATTTALRESSNLLGDEIIAQLKANKLR